MLSRYRDTVRIWSDPVGRALFRLHLRPNHLTVMGLGVSLLTAAAFVAGHTRLAGGLLILAGLFDFFDGSLARASGQVTEFGAFLDSVIDRYSDLVVLLGIVVLFAQMPHARGALVAMAGLVGSIMVSYTKARAESIGVSCTVGVMERPERMICLIAGALFDLLEPALWVLAVLANITAIQRIVFTRRAVRSAVLHVALLAGVLLAPPPVMAAAVAMEPPSTEQPPAAAEPAPPAEAPPSGESAPAADSPSAPAATQAAPTEAPPTVPETTADAANPAAEPPSPKVAEPELTVPVTPARVAPSPSPRPRDAGRTDLAHEWADAVQAYQQGVPAPLVRAFSSEAALRSAIADHVRLLLADALERTGGVVAARAMATSVVDRHRDSRLAPGALITAATLASRAGDESGAQVLLTRLLQSYPDASEVPQALYLLAQSTETMGHRDAAALAYRELLVLAPASGYSDGAADRLAVLAAAGVRTPPLSLSQRIDRAERLLRSGVAKTAADEAERIATESRDAGVVVRALRVVAEGAKRLGQHEAAAQALALAGKRAPVDQRPGLLLEEGRLRIRAGQRDQALGLFAEAAARGAEAEAAEALYQRARLFDELGREGEAAGTYRQVVARYPAREVAGAALWRLGWLAWLRGDAKGAEQQWLRLAETAGGRQYRTGALYWAGRAKEQVGGRAAAATLYRRVLAEAPRSYYGVLSAQRTGAATTTSAAPSVTLPHDPVEAIASDPGFERVDVLRRIGLVEDALLELEHVVRGSIGDPVRLYGFSSAYARDERYHMALRILRRHLAGFATSGHPTIPRAFWELLYPFGWRADLTDAADRAGLDPFLVAAVVREESSYYPRAVSRAGARGLMQLMPGTAEPMAEVRGLAFKQGELLDDPRVNLELGTTFLASLIREFGDPRLALAAYNAGPRRLRQWWQGRRTSDIEAFVEQIPFDETRQYVKRVMLAWEEYRRIYGGS